MIDFQGGVAGWDYRAGFGNSKNKTTDSVNGGYTRDDMIQAALYNNLINPFGPQSAADQAAIDAALVNAQTITSKGDVDFIDGRVTKDIFQLPAGPLSLALGAEYRKEKYTYVAEEITRQVPSIGVDPDSDVTGERNVTAVFAESRFRSSRIWTLRSLYAMTITATLAARPTPSFHFAFNRCQSCCCGPRIAPASVRRRCMRFSSRRL